MSDTYTNLLVHAVFSTKDRQPWISRELRPRLHAYAGGVLRELRCVLKCAGGIEDHVHMVIGLHPDVSVAECMRVVKANTSRWIRQEFGDLSEFGWQRGYAAFSVSRSAFERVEKYVLEQEEHHRARSFIDELKYFLDGHGIVYKPEFLE